MKYNFTEKDLIRDLYNETSFLESSLIQNACNNNQYLRQKMSEFAEAKSLLDDFKKTPPQSVVNKINDYLKNSKLTA